MESKQIVDMEYDRQSCCFLIRIHYLFPLGSKFEGIF